MGKEMGSPVWSKRWVDAAAVNDGVVTSTKKTSVFLVLWVHREEREVSTGRGH